MDYVEGLLHTLFSEHRINPKREFFRLNPEKVVVALKIGKFKDVTPSEITIDSEERTALDKEKAKRPRLKLAAIGIKPGATLTFSRDENRTATVTENNKVSFDGEELSLSAAALKVLGQMGYKTPAASGSEYWMFEGEILDDRRRRIEAQQFDEPGSE